MSDDGKIVALRDRLNNAEEVQPPAGDNRGDDTPKPADGDLPEGCPVVALGTRAGQYFYLDSIKQIRCLKGREHQKMTIIDLFARYPNYPTKIWPRYNAKGTADTFEGETGSSALMGACARKGVFDAFEKIHGPGARCGNDGELVLHHGNKLTIVTSDGHERQSDPGIEGGFVYPADSPMPQPCAKGADGVDAVGEVVFRVMDGVGWKRGGLDAHLYLGGIGLAIIGGAVPFRPAIWIVGSRGCGKSTILDLTARMLGGEAIAGNDVTAASLWQRLQYSSRPVIVDELEAERDNRRADDIVRFIRSSASGGTMLRGSADHEAREFAARGSFIVASVLFPPLKPQDLSRVVILEITGPPKDKRPPARTANEWNVLGAQLRRRMVDGWARYHGTLDAYRAELIEEGHDQRGADAYGALLACADILRFKGDVNPQRVAEFVSQLSPSALMAFDEQGEAEGCLQHLLTSSVRVSSTVAFETVSELIMVGNDGQLRKHGLGLADRDGDRCLIVANNHAALGKIYQDTRWNKEAGTTGGWPQALQRLPGATSGGPKKFSGALARCVFIPLDQIFGGDDVD